MPPVPQAPVSAGVWPSDTIRVRRRGASSRELKESQDVAESVGISNLPEEVASALAADVEYRLHELIEDALKFMRHGKRTKLKVADVDYALRARNLEPLWGFGHADALSFRKATTANGTIWVPDEEEIDLGRILQAPLPPIPPDVSYTAHWLAVEGVQPAVPENPTAAEIAAVNGTGAPSEAQRASLAGANGTAAGSTSVEIRPLVKHVLSRELQLYFERLTTAAADPNDETMRMAALGCLRSDTGLAGLVPYLVQWAAERVVNSLKGDPAVLDQTLSLLNAMLDNQTLFIEPYLHQMMPAILTCLLSSSIEAGPTAIDVRTHASSLLGQILRRYSSAYPTLQPRVLKALLRALVNAQSSIGARVGAVLGLHALGSSSVRSVLGRPANLRTLGAVVNAASGQPDAPTLVTSTMAALRFAFLDERDDDDDDASVSTGPVDLEATFGSLFGGELDRLGEDGRTIGRAIVAEDDRAATSASLSTSSKRKRAGEEIAEAEDDDDQMDVAA